MTTLYFLEFADVAAVAAAQPGVRVQRLPGYVTVTADGPLIVDMLAYPDATGSPTTAPHRALQTARESLDYLERFLSPESAHDPGSAQPSGGTGSISPGSRP